MSSTGVLCAGEVQGCRGTGVVQQCRVAGVVEWYNCYRSSAWVHGCRSDTGVQMYSGRGLQRVSVMYNGSEVQE
jgi:hypothetical protein